MVSTFHITCLDTFWTDLVYHFYLTSLLLRHSSYFQHYAMKTDAVMRAMSSLLENLHQGFSKGCTKKGIVPQS